MAKNTDLIKQLEEKDRELQGSPSVGSVSLLTFPMYTDSPRTNMHSSHQNQKVVLNKGVAEFPLVFGNFENIVGDNSTYNRHAESDLEVVDIIEKFPDIESGKDIQKVLYVVYDIVNKKWDIIERNDVENLTEKYGFQFDNSGLDSYKIGDVIPKGASTTKSTSYDKYGNYGYGKNVKYMYLIGQDTLEDAICVSKSLAMSMTSTEVEEVKVPINDNNILGNLYGDNDVYKAFPDIGEAVKHKTICNKKLIVKNQILFDLKNSNTKRVLPSDQPFYIDGIVTDVDIYCNKDRSEIPRANFNDQILHYLDMTDRFYARIKEITDRIIDSGDDCTDAVYYWNKRSHDLTNPNLKIKDELGSAFGNIVIYFTVKRIVGLEKGQKLVGRYGNKGVIAKVYEDWQMPHLETGERVDMIVNTLGVYNRLNIFQLNEQSITFITQRIIQKMKEPGISVEDKEWMVFRVIQIFNDEQHDKMFAAYKAKYKTKKAKEEFFKTVEEEGIYIHIKPFWHSKNVYDCIMQCYEEFPFIKKYKVYFYEETSQRWCKMMNEHVVGSMYMMKLKQSSKKNMSACANAPINNLDIPVKTDSAKKHRILNSNTPIRSGYQENINHLISIDPEITAKQHLFHRSSPIARRVYGQTIIQNYGLGKPIDPEITDKMTNVNVGIFKARARLMGINLSFDRDVLTLPTSVGNPENDKQIVAHRYNGEIHLSTPNDMLRKISRDIVRERMDNHEIGYIYIGQNGAYKEQVVDEMATIIESDLLEDMRKKKKK